MANTLSLFWDLSSASKKERIDATVKLVSSLEKFQAQHTPKVSPGSEDDEENIGPTDGLDALNAHDVAYSIRRLIRGLASPRESSRLGFSVALTELLTRLDTITCAQIISIIVDGSKTQGSMTGQEERDVLFARLFGLSAVIHSGLLVRQTPLSTSPSSATNPSSLESYKELVDHLLNLGEKKSWLRESAWWTLGHAVDAVIKSSVKWKKEALASTFEVVYGRDKDLWTPETVAVTLKLQPAMPEHNWKKTLAPTFKDADILAPANFSTLGRILKETPGEDELQKSGTGTWKAQLHYVWNVIFDSLLPESEPGHRRNALFQEFFRVVVDDTLFGPSSSPERKFWGFLVFKKALGRVDGADLPMLFTKNFMRCWINHLSQKDRHLHKISQDVVKDIQNVVQQNPELGYTLITGIHGSQQFDKLTRTKTIESILSRMDSDGIMRYIQSLLEQIDESGEYYRDVAAEEAKRIWTADQFAALVRNGAIPKREDWIQLVLNWFTVQGLYVVKKKSDKGLLAALRVTPSTLASEDFRRTCRSKLLGCLADLTSQPTTSQKGDKASKEVTITVDESWISKVFAVVNNLDKDRKHVASLSEENEEEQPLIQQVYKTIENLKQVDGAMKEAAKGVELLLSAFLLHYRCVKLDDDEPDPDTGTCLAAAATMFPADTKSKKRRKSLPTSQPDSPTPIDMLVDVLIGFLEKSTSYLRAVANKTFSCLASAATESTIDLIVAQLERRDPADLIADEEDETESAKSEDEDEDDVESDDDDNESESDGNDEAALALRKKIEDALKANGIEAAAGDTDEESEEELADDEQMMAIDEHLAEVFRSRSGDKQGKGMANLPHVNAQREATHFKNRVLDLVEIFARKMPQSPHILRLVVPLIELATKSSNDEQQLSDKARGILNNRLAKLKEPLQEADQEYAETILDELHIRARKANSSDALATLSHCSLFICRVLANIGDGGPILRLYTESIVDFMARKASSLNIAFFKDFITRYPALGWRLRDAILDTSTKAINAYRKCQAFQLLNIIITLSASTGDPEDVLSFILKLQRSVLHFIDSACDDQVSLSAVQIKDLLKLVMLGVRQASKVDISNQSAWDSGAWHTLHERLVASKRFGSSTAVLKLCSQVESALKAQNDRQSHLIAPKRKAEEVEVEGVSSDTKRKKKKSRPTSQS
ncbi:hypothetical protein K503DRAFT_690102 [Rhizopogon vinicolor AM-OR11-026]|uniref:DNA polymerase V n=1 Tax=Rhizopogon vinicolor AM-OR11-026 TaxID=1314800 RepID=A0A1B7N2W5_9AGAM|nr:hypothetical protein K503DRAFT_690102 [Rhizopogon vinicolor AM-OR11-026]